MSDNSFRIECLGFKNGDIIPLYYTGRGKDISPEFVLYNLSPDTGSIAIIMDDIKHHIFGTFSHWVIWNIPPLYNIHSAVASGKVVPTLGNAMQGVGYGRHRYACPKPPKGKQHIYQFTVYALSQKIELKNNAKKKHLMAAIEPHIIQTATICGKFE